MVNKLDINFDSLKQDSNKILLETSKMDRDIAILIYEGKVYEDESNHQYAFMQAIEESGLKFHWDIDEDREEIIEETYQLSLKNEIYTFSTYSDGLDNYLIAHFESNLNECLFLLKDYFDKGFKLGYYTEDAENNELCYVFKEY